MVMDVHPSGQQPTTTRKTRNFRVITRGNNSFVLTSVKGTKLEGSITDNYVPIAIDDRNGVAYILSAEVIAGVATGRGEVGTFPSPVYTSGNSGLLSNTYRPLMNFSGDDNSFPSKNGPFRSIHFGFSLSDLVDIELQNDYDGSVNVIFACANKPMRIINSGFVVLPGGKFEIIDRSGEKDTNRYSPTNFENTIQLIARSTKIMRVEFNGSTPGGTLPAGQYQYFFSYATADGNETEIVAQSFNLPVFNGEKISNINGGRNTGDQTNKLNKFTLHNIDESYSSVVVYVVVADGMIAESRSAYRINQTFNINGSELSITHTGFEELIRMPVSDLIADVPVIDSAETITQIDGHLVAGNIKEKTYEVAPLRKFARLVKTGHKQITLDLIGTEPNFSRAFNEPLNQETEKSGTDGFNGGYANPKNVHDKLGFWGGEAYPFMARFIFNDGTSSPLFPTSGIDNATNGNLGTLEAMTESGLDALDALGGFSDDGNMINNRGIYRFPNRNAGSQGKLFYNDVATGEGRVTVNGVTFKIPSLDTDLGGGVTIKDITIGIQFFRGERRPDILVQGTMIDCVMIPAVDFDHAGTDEKTWNYSGGQFNESNSKFVPAYGHMLETADVWDVYGDGKRSGDDRRDTGLAPVYLNTLNRDPHSKLNSFKSPFALISSDVIVNPTAFYGMSNKESSAELIYKIKHNSRIKTASINETSGNASHFSVLSPVDVSLVVGTNKYASKSAFVYDSIDLPNAQRFSAFGKFQGRSNDGFEKYFLFRNKYNSYLGVRLDATVRASDPNPDQNEIGGLLFGMNDKDYNSSFLANIYAGSAQKTADQVRDTYRNIDNIRYYPISGKMYWDDTVENADIDNTVEGKLDADRKITLFGGDCYINHCLRKLYNNSEFSDATIVDKIGVVRTGYTIGVVNEGNYNASIRSVEIVNVSEGERSQPYIYGSDASSVGDTLGRGNAWRGYYLTESSGYNKGYNMRDGNITSVGLPTNAPYIQSKWSTRVWASAQHIPNSFDNGYRRFFRGAYKDYPTKNGAITKLITNNNRLFCIQESSVGTIAVNEKIQTANASGGPVFISTGEILSDINPISEEIGSRHKGSIVSTDNAVYGVSLIRNMIWSIDGEGMKRVSDLYIRSFLDEQYGSISNESIELLNHDIASGWNKGHDEVLFTFYKKDGGVFTGDKCFTIMFSEISNRIYAFHSYIPVKYMNVGEKMYSFSALTPKNIWIHDSDDVARGNFYGVQHDSVITFVSNVEPMANKEFTNHRIEGNNVKPKSIVYRVQGAKASHDVVYEENNIIASNAKYKNECWEITIPRINVVHNKDAEEKVAVDKAGARSILSEGSRVKGKYMITEITYDSGESVELQSVSTIFKNMQ